MYISKNRAPDCQPFFLFQRFLAVTKMHLEARTAWQIRWLEEAQWKRARTISCVGRISNIEQGISKAEVQRHEPGKELGSSLRRL